LSPIRIPVHPQTIGDHLRLRRLTLKLQQKQVAKRLGTTEAACGNWELHGATPSLTYMPAIIEFLGYNPLPPAANWAERLVRGRTTLGLTQKTFARKLGVDPSTLARWERGEREPAGALEVRAERLLAATGEYDCVGARASCTAVNPRSILIP
jgi:transcriptional regulator with XRE-family HTH domain